MSIQTINGSIISNYPVFEGSQVLTSEQLNGMFDYLDQQNRFTRSRLIGIGIVCGLHLRTTGDQVTLSEGIGITSDGFIVKMTECTMSFQRDYFLPPTVAYEAFGSYDKDNIFTQDDDIILYELLHKEPIEGVYEKLTADFVSDKYMLIFLECFDRDPRSCLGKNCEDLGKERIFTTRKLAVNEAGLKRILRKTNGTIQNPFFPSSTLKRVDLKKPLFDPEGNESKTWLDFVKHYKSLIYASADPQNVFFQLFGVPDQKGLLQATYTEFQPLLEPVYNYKDPFEASNLFTSVKNNLRTYLAGATGDNLNGVQYAYEFLELVIQTYHEFMDVGARITQACCPQKDFSLHVLLGKIVWDDSKEKDEWDILGQSQYRHQFLQPKILNSQDILLKELISVHKKLLLMVESFQINVIKEKSVSGKDGTIKITPLDPKFGAIPRYLNANQHGSVEGIKTTTLEKEWHFDTTVTGKEPTRVRSYDNNEITHVTLSPARTGYVDAPLLYRNYSQNFKAEAIFGEPLDKVVEGETSIRDDYHLPFSILPVKINPETTNIIVEPRFWQDMQTSYNVIKGEINVVTRNLVAGLRSFQRVVDSIDYGATSVNCYNFKIEIEKVRDEIDQSGGLVYQAESLPQSMPIQIQELYDNGALPNPFKEWFDHYRMLRRNLQRNSLKLRYAREILIQEKLEVLEPQIFQEWKSPLENVLHDITEFLGNNDFFQLHKLYHSFVIRYKYLQLNHYSVFGNFMKLHPGLDFNEIHHGGTHVLVYDDKTLTDDLEDAASNHVIFANFSLPYRLTVGEIDIPLDPALEGLPLPPLARGESILLRKGEIFLMDATANDLESNGGALRVDRKGVVNEDEFISGVSFHGAKVVSHGGANALLRYEPASSFSGADHFEYTVENESDNTLQDIAHVEVLVVDPYRKHLQAFDDLAATDNHHSVTIDILNNDTSYSGVTVILPETSDFGASLQLTGDNRVIYTPVHGREGKDTFNYQIEYEFDVGDTTQLETSQAEVEVVVFCCDKTEFEVICEGNPGKFRVLSNREVDEKSTLRLIDEEGKSVEELMTPHSEIKVTEEDGMPYLYYQPELYFKGKDRFIYEITDGAGFLRRVTIEVLVMPCTQTYLRRTLKNTTGRFKVLESDQGHLSVFETRDALTDFLKTTHGSVNVDTIDGTACLVYEPDPGYFGLDFFEFAFQDGQGIMHYNTMQVIVDGHEQVRVESTFQDTPATFHVLDDDMLTKGYEVAVFAEQGDFMKEIDSAEGGNVIVLDGAIKYTPKTSFLGDDSFRFVVLEDLAPIAYGKFFVIVDTNRKVHVEYTYRDIPKEVQVLTELQATSGAVLAITQNPSVDGAVADLVTSEGPIPFIRYTPAIGYVGQDSFGYSIELDEVVLYGTVYMIIDTNERIEVINVFKNRLKEFRLFEMGANVSEFDIMEPTQNGTLTQLPDNLLQYLPENDYVGSDKFKYRARIGSAIQYGTVFIMVTCECKDIMITGTVSENSTMFPLLENVRVEEVETGEFVYTGKGGLFSIQAAPDANLRFSKETHDTLEIPVAYRNLLNVQLDRKQITVSGIITDQDTGKAIANAKVMDDMEGYYADGSGKYEIVTYASATLNYASPKYIGQERVMPNSNTVINVALERIKVNIMGTVVDSRGDFLIHSTFEFLGKTYDASEGDFEADVPIDTEMTFHSPGFESATYIATKDDDPNIVLERKQINVTGTVTDVDTGEPLPNVSLLSNDEFYLISDIDGVYDGQIGARLKVEFVAEGYYKESIVLPAHDATIDVALKPIIVKVKGVVVNEEGIPISDSTYTIHEETFDTSDGEFDIDIQINKSILFGAKDFDNQYFFVYGEQEGVQVMLYSNLITIGGKVTHAETGEPLDQVSILIGEKEYQSDEKGFYTLKTEKGIDIGFTKTGFIGISVNVIDSNLKLNIALEPDSKELVTVSGRVVEQADGPLPIWYAEYRIDGDGTEYPTKNGDFTAEVPLGSNVIFSAVGFQNETFLVKKPFSGIDIYLERLNTFQGQVTNVSNYPLEAKVTNLRTGEMVMSKSNGFFSIQAEIGDEVLFEAGENVPEKRIVKYLGSLVNVMIYPE